MPPRIIATITLDAPATRRAVRANRRPAPREIGTTRSESVDRSVYVRYLHPDGVLRARRNQPQYRPPKLEAYPTKYMLTAAGEAERLKAASKT